MHEFFAEINDIHPNIKFTMLCTAQETHMLQQNYTCQPLKSIPYLDILEDTSSSCGGLRPSSGAFFALWSKKGPLLLFWLTLGHFGVQ